MQRAQLHVEGKDDVNAVLHLLLRHGFPFDAKPLPAYLPMIEKQNSLEALIDGIGKAIKMGKQKPAEFVIEDEVETERRWDGVRDRLRAVDVAAPDSLDPAGFVGESTEYKCRVGIWLMPDNQNHGEFEDFLAGLIPEGSALYQHATDSTAAARTTHQAKFRREDELKAGLHAYLAWQEVPGLPFGTAIKAHYCNHDSPAALAFVAWFKTLYGIQ